MDKLVFLLKTYNGDLDYMNRLMESFHKHNMESLKLFLVAPQSDKPIFEQFLTDTVHFISDEEIPAEYGVQSEAESKNLGFWNPGIVRLAFWKLGLCENYFAIDSDMVFIRNFGLSDFVSTGDRPFIAVSENLTEKIDPFYFNRYWAHRQKSMNIISQFLEVRNPSWAWVHNSQVFNARILKNMETYLAEKGLPTYKSLMEVAPYEFFWYTLRALNQTEVKIEIRSEWVKMINHQGEHLSLWQNGTRTVDLARSYLGVIINSNWSRQYGVINFDKPPEIEYRRVGKWAEWVGGTKQ